MPSNEQVKLGLIGVGGMGNAHIDYLVKMPSVALTGVCDIVPSRADAAAARSGSTAYYDHMDMLARAELDAVLIATPHYAHTPISEHAFARGLHVLCEKPLAVHINDAQRSIDAYEQARAKNPQLIFGVMFNERTIPAYRKLKDLLQGGELGRLSRVTWINTAWFRSQAYYDSGGWRATWAGEGGGILSNQCPHNLDMYQWLFGLPARITGHANLGKYHNIEVEDEVTAYFEHDNGMIGHFIVSTSESPGTNRLEIVGEYGKVVLEHGKITFARNRESMLKFLRETETKFEIVENWQTDIPIPGGQEVGHHVVTEKFVRAILTQQPEHLIAQGSEGIRGVTLANGIMLSSFQQQTISVPFDGNVFVAELNERIANSTFVKQTTEKNDQVTDFSGSFSK